MANKLLKVFSTTYIPGSPGTPGSPGQPYRPAYTAIETRRVCTNRPVTTLGAGVTSSYERNNDIHSIHYGEWQTRYTVPGSGTVVVGRTTYSYVCSDQRVTVNYPAQPFIPPTNPIPATPAQVINNLNLGWNSGARSIASFVGDGHIEFKVPAGLGGTVIGLNDNDTGYGYLEIDHAWYFNNEFARVFENGVTKFTITSYDAGDTFEIWRIDNEVTYYRNDVLEYTSLIPSTGGRVFMDASMYYGGDFVYDPLIAALASIEPGDFSGFESMSEFVGLAGSHFLPLTGSGGDVDFAISATSLLPLTSSLGVFYGSSASLLPLAGLGTDTAVYGAAAVSLEPLEADYAEGGMFAPSPPVISQNFLLWLEGAGTGMSGEVGSSAASLEPLDAGISSDHPYGEAVTHLEPLFGFAHAYEGNNNATLYDTILVEDAWTVLFQNFAIMMSGVTVTTVMLVEVMASAEMMSDVTVTASMLVDMALEALMYSLVTVGTLTPIYDDDVSVWVVEDEAEGSTRYEQYGFSSFALFQDVYLGTKADGVYQLDGDTDEDQPVRAMLSLGKRDFGTPELKRISNAYLGLSKSSGRMFVKVISEGQAYIYATRRHDRELQIQRADIGKGLRANYFTLEIYNEEGSDFELSSIEFLPVAVKRRI